MGISVDSSYFQRLSLCEMLQRTAVVIASDVGVFAKLGFVTIGAFVLVWACVLPVLMAAFDLDADQLNDPEYLKDHLGPFYLLLLMNLFVFFLMTAVGNGALVRAVAELYLHQRPSAKACIQVGIRHSTEIIKASFLGFSGVLIGCLFFVLPGYYLMVKWFLVNPVIITEGLGAIAALKRSWNLVSGSWCYVFCTWFICFTVGMVFHLLWQSAFPANAFTFYGSIIGSIPSFIVNPIIAVMMTIMYINLRIEKEGLNADVFSRELGAGAAYSSLIDRSNEENEKEEVYDSNAV